LPPLSFPLEFKTSAFGFLDETMNFDEVIQLQVLKHKGPDGMASTVVWSIT
jgi:hypothetical protein